MKNEEYKQLLDNHDWNHEYSDDHKVFKKGQEDYKKLIEISHTSIRFRNMFLNKQSEMIK